MAENKNPENPRPDLYTFLEYRKFLRALCTHLKETTSFFSFRYLSKRAGFSSPNYVQWVIEGKRNLSKKSLRPLMMALRLTNPEQLYFEHLVFFNQSEKNEDKNHYYKKLILLQRGSPVVGISKDQFDYFSNWYNPVIRELMVLPEYGDNPEKIGKAIMPPVSPSKIQKSVDLLKKLGLVKEGNHGRWELTHASIATDAQVKSLAVKNYHHQAIGLGRDAMERFNRENRNISAITMGLSKKSFELVQERLEQFWGDLHRIASLEKKVEKVYQVNLQVFPMSKKGSDL